MAKRVGRWLAIVGVGAFIAGLILGDTTLLAIATVLVIAGVIWG